jgi:steroid delta-isomerase-like uncharacterized protein
MPENAKQFLDRLFAEVWSKGDLDAVSKFYAPDIAYFDPTMPPIQGIEGLKQYVWALHVGYPDIQFTVEQKIVEGDNAAVRWRCEGTHKGEFMGIPATGKRTQATGISTSRLEGGKIIENWVIWDALNLLRQLGIIPPAE